MAGRPEDDFECAICQDIMRAPVVLPCSHRHAFCKECLTRWMAVEINAKCPCCRQGASLREIVPHLQVNQDLQNRITAFQRRPADNTAYCQEHPVRRVILFCRTCNIRICQQCVVPGIGHHVGHTYGEMQAGENSRQPGQVQITVKTEAGRPKAVLVFPTDSVESLKQKIEQLTGTPCREQRFIGGGKEFRDGHRLSDYNVREGMILQMVVRGVGGHVDPCA